MSVHRIIALTRAETLGAERYLNDRFQACVAKIEEDKLNKRRTRFDLVLASDAAFYEAQKWLDE